MPHPTNSRTTTLSTPQKCKEVTKEVEVCKDEEGEEDVVVCETKCFKADKVISIGKGEWHVH